MKRAPKDVHEISICKVEMRTMLKEGARKKSFQTHLARISQAQYL